MKCITRWAITLCMGVGTALAQSAPDSVVAANPEKISVLQPPGHDGVMLDKQNFFQNFLHDEGEIWRSPFHMNRDQTELWAGVSAATVLVMTVDEPISRDVLRFRSEHVWVQTVSPIATQFGQFYFPYSVAALSCFDGLAFGDEERLDTGLMEVQAMIHSGVVVQVLKHLFGRSRPFVDHGKIIWYGPRTIFTRYHGGGFSPYDSFPSGHTITAFSLAEVVADREQPWIGVIAYTCAGLCGISRLSQNDHWLSDVVFGGALGMAIGKFEVDTHKEHYTISPTLGLGSAGVSIKFN